MYLYLPPTTAYLACIIFYVNHYHSHVPLVENQYFGEDANAQKLDIGEEEQQGEDEQEGRDDRDQFPEDQANQENDNQDLDAANN